MYVFVALCEKQSYLSVFYIVLATFLKILIK